MPSSSNRDQRVGNVIDPIIEVEGPSSVQVTHQPKIETERLSDEEILKSIRKKSYLKAKRLLEEIKQFPLKINWNKEGLARLNGH